MKYEYYFEYWVGKCMQRIGNGECGVTIIALCHTD
jgi:hypothetical protein